MAPMLEPTPRARDVVTRVREFVHDEVVPLESKLGGGSFKDLLPHLEKARERGKAAGLWAPYLPPEHGGMGLSLFDYA
ncbi:MAG TPA: acyl-CoA dehydrogenase family protein, partial [Polyangiaceae bacterium]